MRRPLAALGLALLMALGTPMAWSQGEGQDTPLNAPDVQAPTTITPPSSGIQWNLSDLLWGISKLESSPRKLSQAQKDKIRPNVERVLEGATLVKTFDQQVKRILTTDQMAYLEHMAQTGELAKDPLDLPEVAPGQDPLVLRVVQILEERAGN